MSDPRLRDPVTRMSDRDFGVRYPRDPGPNGFADAPVNYMSDRGHGALLGIIAVVAILILGGLFYYSTRTDTAFYPPNPTTGAAPLNEPRPAPIIVPEQPAPPTKSAQ